jgi:hypothetical protein
VAGDKVLPKLRIVYREAPGFRIVPITGARGGPSPQGFVVATFYHERFRGPEVVIRDQETKKEVPEGEADGRITIERMQEFGVFLTPEAALAVSEWLEGHARKLLEARKSKKQPKAGKT